jgi:hypothetical protein
LSSSTHGPSRCTFFSARAKGVLTKPFDCAALGRAAAIGPEGVRRAQRLRKNRFPPYHMVKPHVQFRIPQNRRRFTSNVRQRTEPILLVVFTETFADFSISMVLRIKDEGLWSNLPNYFS